MSDKPVWMETWTSEGEELVFDPVPQPTHWEPAHCVARAALAAAAAQLARALLAVEWNGVQVGRVRHCPSCRGAERHGRDYNGVSLDDGKCDLDDALTRAGFPDQASRDEARRMMAEAKR